MNMNISYYISFYTQIIISFRVCELLDNNLILKSSLRTNLSLTNTDINHEKTQRDSNVVIYNLPSVKVKIPTS